MHLNEYGLIAKENWLNTPNIRTGVFLGEFIIMPNHIHAIVIIDRGERIPDSLINLDSEETAKREGITLRFFKPNDLATNGVSPFKVQSQTLGAIIRGYKATVTKQVTELGLKDRLWNKGFYDRIIPDQTAYDNITEYIRTNPTRWKP
jgi:REP element-mobilizing transposase RayT